MLENKMNWVIFSIITWEFSFLTQKILIHVHVFQRLVGWLGEPIKHQTSLHNLRHTTMHILPQKHTQTYNNTQQWLIDYTTWGIPMLKNVTPSHRLHNMTHLAFSVCSSSLNKTLCFCTAQIMTRGESTCKYSTEYTVDWKGPEVAFSWCCIEEWRGQQLTHTRK